MNTSLAHTYYIKALDAYPFDLTEVVESLNYALSYDACHAGAHSMMGWICMEYFRDNAGAEEHFLAAIASDMDYPTSYELYSLLLIGQRRFDEAIKLIRHAQRNHLIGPAIAAHRTAMIYESKGKLERAKACMKEAMLISCEEKERNEIKAELDRIKSKLSMRKKRKKGPKKKAGSK